VSDSGTVFGLLSPNLGETEVFEPICGGMASAPGAHALLRGSSRNVDTDIASQALQLCRQFIERGVSGVFFAPREVAPNREAVNARICSMIDEARMVGYREASGDLPARIQVSADLSPESLIAAWKALNSRAVVCANDRIAAELMRALLPVPLTTVHQPCRELGIAAMLAMEERLKRPEIPARQILLDCFLVVRESSG
jgi:DNA-binding LacI/PurR family transcriptional regulator